MKLDRSQIEADFRALIGPLCDAVGPSGFEDEVADLLRKELADCDVELSDDVMGNLIAYKKGNKKGSVLIAAHMDEIGLIIRHIDSKGFLWVETLGGIAPQQYHIALHNDIIISIFRPECALAYEELCAAEGRVGRIQIKIETGMNRLGVRPGEDLAVLLTTLAACPQLSVCGVYSHFATATNCVNDAFTIEQHDRFMRGLRQIEAAGIRAQYVHCCNSAAVTWFEEAFHNSVRVGGILYGHLVMEDGVEPVDIQEIITLRAYITNLHTMPAGESIGYPQKFRSGTDLQLATLSVGFADGIPVDYARGQGPILVHGRRTRFLELCMDQSIIDVTGIPCKVGDEVTLIGQDGDERISVYSIEKRTGRTFDALLTFISDRIARICR